MIEVDLQAQIDALKQMTIEQLHAEWRRVYRAPSPALNKDLLMRGIAWRLQERVFGGLSASTERELKRLGRQLERRGELDLERNVQIKPGTRLVREWGGVVHHVTVVDGGFLYNYGQYGSLSEIATHITGVRWSGPRFFGLRRGDDINRKVAHGA